MITVELDKERAPQIRVTQGKEHPAFLQLFNGSMIILCGKSESNPIEKCNNRGVSFSRYMYTVGVIVLSVIKPFL